jgi:hypothetical protein
MRLYDNKHSLNVRVGRPVPWSLEEEEVEQETRASIGKLHKVLTQFGFVFVIPSG